MFENEFYPTPTPLVNKMIEDLELDYFGNITSVLEPSAGKGDIAEAIKQEMLKYRKKDNIDIDTIEIDPDLAAILRDKNFRVVHDDFLTFRTFKKYDLIIMNPPFSNGDKHLLKALEMQKNGGQIIAILNAETIRNPFSNTRKQLLQILKDKTEYTVEFLTESFTNAERTTDVEVALLKIEVNAVQQPSYFKAQLDKATDIKEAEQPDQYHIAQNDMVREIVRQYSMEAELGVKLINEYEAMKPFILRSFDKSRDNKPTLCLTTDIYSNYFEDVSVNKYLKLVRYKYWNTLFDNKKFTSNLTSNLLSNLRSRIDEFSNYDFTLYNVYNLQLELSKNMVVSIEDTILNVFDELSHEFSYTDYSSNIHYFNGWSTNKSWYINKKVIIPFNDVWGWRGSLNYDYNVREKLSDIEKALNYLNGNKPLKLDIQEVLKDAKNAGETKNIEFNFFKITFYQKGTAHITFTDLELLKRLNIYAGQKRSWLPPTYGKTPYQDMSESEQAVINEFEGEESYNKVYQHKDEYLVETEKMLALN